MDGQDEVLGLTAFIKSFNMNFVWVTGPDESFINELVSTFPEIREYVLNEDNNGLIHIQVGDFTIFTQKAIDDNNVPLALKCFKFVEEVINKVKPKTKDALIISWIFHLYFGRNESLYAQFPPGLKEIRNKLEEKEAEYVLKNRVN